MMRVRTAPLLVLAAACTGEPTIPTDYVPLLTGDWTLAAGTEGYYCVRTTINEDMFIRSLRPIAPLGTHHTALAYDLQGGPDGTFPCGAADVGFKLLFGSGLGTDPFELPDGVAFKLPAGEQILLNLHLYNTSDEPLSGRSGVEILRVAEADVVHEAETIYAIATDLTVPPGPSTTSASCMMSDDGTIFGTFPHMHRLGARMTATAHHGDVATMFHDLPYNFETQLNYHVGPIEVVRGDTVSYQCAFDNPTSQTVHFGDSSDAEMCVLGLYRYPARTGISLCLSQ